MFSKHKKDENSARRGLVISSYYGTVNLCVVLALGNVNGAYSDSLTLLEYLWFTSNVKKNQ